MLNKPLSESESESVINSQIEDSFSLMNLVFNSPPLTAWNVLLVETRGFKTNRRVLGHQILYLNNVFRTDLEMLLFPWNFKSSSLEYPSIP